jgi:hypothetical protein
MEKMAGNSIFWRAMVHPTAVQGCTTGMHQLTGELRRARMFRRKSWWPDLNGMVNNTQLREVQAMQRTLACAKPCQSWHSPQFRSKTSSLNCECGNPSVGGGGCQSCRHHPARHIRLERSALDQVVRSLLGSGHSPILMVTNGRSMVCSRQGQQGGRYEYRRSLHLGQSIRDRGR